MNINECFPGLHVGVVSDRLSSRSGAAVAVSLNIQAHSVTFSQHSAVKTTAGQRGNECMNMNECFPGLRAWKKRIGLNSEEVNSDSVIFSTFIWRLFLPIDGLTAAS